MRKSRKRLTGEHLIKCLQLQIYTTDIKLSAMSVVARVSKRYQVVIPKEVRREVGIKEGDRVLFEIEGSEIRIRKLRNFLELEGSLEKALSPEDIRDRVEEEIAKDAL